MLGNEYDYFDNWEAAGDSENFYNTRRRRHNIRGCLKNEIERTSRGGVAKAFVANTKNRKKHRRRNDENDGYYAPYFNAPRKSKKRQLQPSSRAGGNGNMIQSRSEAAQIFRQTSREKPVATVKPMLRQEESTPNLLGDLLKRQDEFLKPASKSTFEPKEPIHQKENPLLQMKKKQEADKRRRDREGKAKAAKAFSNLFEAPTKIADDPVSKKPVATSSPFSSSSVSTASKKTNNPALIKRSSLARGHQESSTSGSGNRNHGEDARQREGQQQSADAKCNSVERLSKRPTSSNNSRSTCSSGGSSSSSAKNSGAKNEAKTTFQRTSEEKKRQVSEHHLNKATDKTSILLNAEESVKTYLKPKFNEGLVSKENYKTIVRKCVEKIYAKDKVAAPGAEVSKEKVKKLVHDCVERYKNH